ncbi:damage-inducible protein DinB [Adhaeribacter arboris]|uniref:Damage-inducible protein DinB n=1 Tax=Adhaeribacter arboris TaxID=2072846 RepID=A0A2T2YGQ6_9BACT|nr:DinB family protein [Adhaeribacter arboris]PSR54706.1 damage-inducible protein DinB [Adhaeribacter arboris]
MDLLQQQYKLIQSARAALFSYGDTFTPAHFTEELPAFGGSSIRSLLVHTANTYQFWLGNFAQAQELPFMKPLFVTNLNEVRRIFQEVNSLTEKFLQHFEEKWLEPVTGEIPWRKTTMQVTPLALFTHVITHECHHKGQVVWMSRQLGYTPPDTDVLRF